MEIPDTLKTLYRHWDLHTAVPQQNKLAGLFSDSELYRDITWFITERNAIWEKKVTGKQPPYTEDPILATYRFCNIFREFDRQTIEFHTLLNPLRDNFALWLLNMFYCRMVARTETVNTVGLLSFDQKENHKLYKRLMASPRPRFGTPYVFPVSVIQKSTTPTREKFIAEYLPSVMNDMAMEISSFKSKAIYDGLELLIPKFQYNLRFLWTEVLIDVAYQFPQHVDLFQRFPIGPGSLPTMNKITTKQDPTLLVAELAAQAFETGVTYHGRPVRLSAENWEGIGCEFRKYTNLKSGTGRKRIFANRALGCN